MMTLTVNKHTVMLVPALAGALNLSAPDSIVSCLVNCSTLAQGASLRTTVASDLLGSYPMAVGDSRIVAQ